MTELDKQHLRDRKAELAASLSRAALKPKKRVRTVLKANAGLNEYVREVAKNPDRHNVYEVAGVGMFLDLLNRYEWKQKRYDHFCHFYEACEFHGNEGPVHYKITPIQWYIFAIVYGLYVPKTVKKVRVSGIVKEVDVPSHRLIRELILYVPRKFSKTSMSAAMAVYDLLCGDLNSRVFMASNSSAQSSLCYDEAYAIMEGFFPQMKTTRDKDKKLNKSEIIFNDARLGRRSYIKCLAAAPKRLDGLNASTVIMDEYSQAADTATKRGDALKNVLTTSMATRRNPLTIVITTASDNLTGPFHQYDLPHYQKMLLGDEPWNDTLFPILFMPDVDDYEGDVSTWEKVQPHWGITVQPEFYQSQWLDAQDKASNMVDFRTKLLNVPCVNEATIWIAGTIARKAAHPFDPLKLEGVEVDGCRAFMAVDLSERNDFTAVTTGLYIEQLQQIWMHTRYFVPDGIGVRKCSIEAAQGLDIIEEYDNGIVKVEDAPFDGQIHSNHENRYLYQQWADAGLIELTHGEVVDYERVAAYCMEVTNSLNEAGVTVVGIGYDDWKSTEFINILASMGGSDGLMPIGQTYGDFTPACKFFEHSIHTGHIYIDPNPVTEYCCNNAVLDVDKLENCKPMKRDPSKRIDGLITMCMVAKMFVEQGHKVRKNDFEK